MNGFNLSRLAEADINHIVDYLLAESGPGIAQIVYDELYKAFRNLVKFPHSGHRHADLTDQTLRVCVVHSYLIIFWPDTTPLSISRIIHGSRDLARQHFPAPY